MQLAHLPVGRSAIGHAARSPADAARSRSGAPSTDARRVEGCVAPDEAPRMVALARSGQPPLRLKARRLWRHETNVPGGGLYLELWLRPKGGAVTAFGAIGDARMPSDALQAADIETLAEMIEARFASPAPGWPDSETGQRPAGSTAPEVAAALVARLSEMSEARAFRALLSDALDAWTADAAPADTAPSKGSMSISHG